MGLLRPLTNPPGEAWTMKSEREMPKIDPMTIVKIDPAGNTKRVKELTIEDWMYLLYGLTDHIDEVNRVCS